MRKRAKKKKRMYSVRSPNGRFCKTVPDALAKGQVAKPSPVGVEGVAKGEGGETPIKCLDLVVQFNYWHPRLKYPVVIKRHDYYTNLL